MQEPTKTGQQITGAPSIQGLEIIESLGKGSIAAVYKGKQTNTGRFFAVKVYSAEALGDAGVARFASEGKGSVKLAHQNLARVYAAEKTKAGDMYLVMEYLDGKPLDAMLADKSIERKQLGRLLCELLSGLDYAHKCGLVHKDLKPANIMVVQTQNGPQGKIMDFGVAKSLGADAQKMGQASAFGTAAYMSPEQCLGRDIEPRSDIYSMACLIYECFSGSTPFDGSNNLELMYKHISAPAPSAAQMKLSCGEKLADLLSSALSKNPEDRPATAGRMRDSLERALDGLPESFDAAAAAKAAAQAKADAAEAAKKKQQEAKEQQQVDKKQQAENKKEAAAAASASGGSAEASEKKGGSPVLIVLFLIVIAAIAYFAMNANQAPKAPEPTPAETFTTTGAGSPTGSDTTTPAGSDTATPAGSDTATPTGSGTTTQAGSDSATPAGSDSATPAGADTAAPTQSNTETPPG